MIPLASQHMARQISYIIQFHRKYLSKGVIF